MHESPMIISKREIMLDNLYWHISRFDSDLGSLWLKVSKDNFFSSVIEYMMKSFPAQLVELRPYKCDNENYFDCYYCEELCKFKIEISLVCSGIIDFLKYYHNDTGLLKPDFMALNGSYLIDLSTFVLEKLNVIVFDSEHKPKWSLNNVLKDNKFFYDMNFLSSDLAVRSNKSVNLDHVELFMSQILKYCNNSKVETAVKEFEKIFFKTDSFATSTDFDFTSVPDFSIDPDFKLI